MMLHRCRCCWQHLRRDYGSKVTAIDISAISRRSVAAIYLSSISTALDNNHNTLLKLQPLTTHYDRGSVLQLPRCNQVKSSSTLPIQQSIHVRGFAATVHSGMSSSILPHIHIDAPSYAQYPLQLKLLQHRWFSSNHRGRGNRRYQDPDMRVCQSIEELTQMAYEHKDTMSPRGMSAYWTLVSKLLHERNNRPSDQMQIQIDELIGQTLRSCETYNPRDMSTIAISLAKIIDKASKSHRRHHYGSPEQILQDVLIGKESKKKEYIFNYIASASVPILYEFNGRDISNFIYAFGLVEEVVLVENGSTFFDMLAEEVLSFDDLDEFKPQELSNLLWAYANVKVSNSQLFKKVADHIVGLDNLNEFWPQHLSNIVWAFATAGEPHPQLFKKLAGEAIKRQHEFIPQDTSNTVWAYATNGQVDKHLFSSLVPSVKANLDKYNCQNLINVAWAYAVANVDAPSVFNNDFINACSRKENEFILEDLFQLHQWQLWQEELKSDVSLPLPLKKRCYEAFVSQDPTLSKLQDDVISSLSAMGLQPQEEVLMESGYRIDAIVEVNGKQIAIEVDGPSHFIGRELTGSTILKHRQVTNLDGMQLVSVPYWEWNKLKKDNKKKEQYLWNSLGN